MRQKLLLLLFSISPVFFSQALSAQAFHNRALPTASGEEIILETDRQFYCVDESIYLTASYKFHHPMDGVPWSTVIYVELLRWTGEKVAQAKFKLFETSASGYLKIPKTLLSGNYYLRAYTKWMRNFPVEDYTYSLVKVINPFESIIDQGPIGEPDEKYVYSKPAKGNFYHGIECFTDKSTYQQREKVDLTIRLKELDSAYSNICVSVAKAAYADTNNYLIQFYDQGSPKETSLTYLPEFRGISISGKTLATRSGGSLANTTIYLSTPQNWKHFATFRTKENGRFHFALPDFYGPHDYFIDAVLENGESAEVWIDSDYCMRSTRLRYIPFSLDTKEKDIALEMSINMQLFNMYNEESGIQTSDSTTYPFYVRPTHVYDMKEYIQLPNLEEFFYELVTEVRTIRTKEETYLKLVAFSQYPELKPLLLLDNILVSDVDEFLKIPLDRVEKVELIDKPYMVSGMAYSGIICVSTTRKDFAGIKLPENSFFFSYNLLSGGNFNKSDYSSLNTYKLTYRQNLLYWDPGIELNQDQPHTLSFYTSDSKGEYIVYVRSLNARGEAQLYGSCKIRVE